MRKDWVIGERKSHAVSLFATIARPQFRSNDGKHRCRQTARECRGNRNEVGKTLCRNHKRVHGNVLSAQRRKVRLLASDQIQGQGYHEEHTDYARGGVTNDPSPAKRYRGNHECEKAQAKEDGLKDKITHQSDHELDDSQGAGGRTLQTTATRAAWRQIGVARCG